jgi:hypothetical protein
MSKKPSPDSRRLFCSQCGAQAKAACDCRGAFYVPARMYAAQAIAANPGKSNRVLAKEIGVDESTVRVARKAVAGNPATDIRRIGQDGKNYPATKPSAQRVNFAIEDRTEQLEVPYYVSTEAQRFTYKHANPTPDELVHTPEAEEVIDAITPIINALRNEGKIRATVMSPARVSRLLYTLLSQIFKCKLGSIYRARACVNCALEWRTAGTIPTKKEIDAVTAVIDAWSELRKKLVTAVQEEPATQH